MWTCSLFQSLNNEILEKMFFFHDDKFLNIDVVVHVYSFVFPENVYKHTF